MQVYRGMDIGTAKPTGEQRARVPHHLIDLADPGDAFSVAEFQREGRLVLTDLARRGVPALIVGGSGLHFRALVDPLEFPPHDPAVRRAMEALAPGEAVAALVAADPGAGEHLDLGNPRRVARALEIHRLTGLTPTVRWEGEQAAAVREYRPLLPLVALGIDPGERLPASYANFYIGNRVVLVPMFDCPNDRAAVEILAGCFPGRRAVAIDSRALVVGLGAFHCLTQQVPAP